MATNPGSAAKDDLLGQIWSICTTLTEEAMTVASTKAGEAGFDVNRGSIPTETWCIRFSKTTELRTKPNTPTSSLSR